MGKKKREKAVAAKKNTAPAVKKPRDRKKTIKAIIIASVVFVLIAAMLIGFFIMSENGVFMRNRKITKCEGVTLDGAMMTYFFWDHFNVSLTSNSGYYKQYGLETADDLDDTSPMGNTWREGFLENTIEFVNVYLDYASFAIDNDISVSKESLDGIEDKIQTMKNKATVSGMSFGEYLSSNYGRGVKEEDVRNALMLEELSTAGYAFMLEDYKPSDTDIRDYYNENQKYLQMTDFCFFSVGISGKDNLTDEQKRYFSEKADYIAKSTSVDDFKMRVGEYLREQNNSLALDDENRLDGDELDEYINSTLDGLLREAVEYDDTLTLYSWIFDPSRFAGDTYINHIDPYGTYGVVYIVTPAYINEEWEKTAENAILTERITSALDEIGAKYTQKCDNLANAITDIK